MRIINDFNFLKITTYCEISSVLEFKNLMDQIIQNFKKANKTILSQILEEFVSIYYNTFLEENHNNNSCLPIIYNNHIFSKIPENVTVYEDKVIMNWDYNKYGAIISNYIELWEQRSGKLNKGAIFSYEPNHGFKFEVGYN